MTLYSRYFREPGTNYFLFGPRGTGKSTLIRQLHPHALWIDLLRPDLERSLLSTPEKLLQMIEGSPEKKVVVIDEIQKVPALLNIVHMVIERKQGHQFVLNGSSSRKLKRTGANLLGGRAYKKTLHPFIASELKTDFQLERALNFGLLPLLIEAKDPSLPIEQFLQNLTPDSIL